MGSTRAWLSRGRVAIAVGAASLLTVVPSAAQPPSLGTGFGNLGWRSFGDPEIADIAVRADGSFVVHASRLIGLLSDGRLDRRFGSNGVITEARRTSGAAGSGRSITFQPDGKLLVAGGATLARRLRDGRLDPSFGADGRVALAASANGVAVAPDGKIVVALVEKTSPSLARFLADGTPDASFGAAGRAAVAARVLPPIHIAVQSDGKVVVAGREGAGEVVTNLAPLSRYLADGSLDTAFGTSGFAHADGVPADALALQPDGKIIVAGWRNTQGVGTDTNLLRFLPNGRRDPSFGVDGLIRRRSQGGAAIAPRAIAPTPNGAIAIAGRAYPTICCKGVYWVAARVTPDGVWTGGRAPDLVDPEEDCWGEVAEALAVQPDGGILVGGSTCYGSLVGRYTPEFELDSGLPLFVSVDGGRLRVSTPGNTTSVSGMLRLSDSAKVIVSVRRSGVGDVSLLAGSRLGSKRLLAPKPVLAASFTRRSRFPVRLVLPRVAARRNVRYVVRIDAADDRGRIDRPRVPVLVPPAR